MRFWIFQFLTTLLLARCVTPEDYVPTADACTQCTCQQVGEYELQPGFVLDCSISGFKGIFAEWPLSTTLSDQSKYMASYSGNDIKSLKQLPATERSLWFSCRHCGLTEIESAVFLDTPNIEFLDLSFNEFTGDELLPDIFRGRFSTKGFDTIALQVLDLSHNKIVYLQGDLFEHTPFLQRLTTSNNPFMIPLNEDTIAAISTLTELKYLDMSNIGMETLPDKMLENLVNLLEINISGNKFITVPESLSLTGRSLQTLNMAYNPIERLTENSFLGLQKVQYLNISHIDALSEIVNGTFDKLPSIIELYLNENRNLTSLDLGEFQNMKSLKKIDISNSGIHSLEFDHSAEFINFLTGIELNVNDIEWHCNCRFFQVLESLEQIVGVQDFRCFSPYEMSGILSSSFTQENICSIESQPDVKLPRMERPPFLRPRAILLSILAVCAVIVLGLFVGFVIGFIQKKLRDNSIMAPQPIKYTTIRESGVPI